jgi:multicomponent Na+:H+ antiporter subunit G
MPDTLSQLHAQGVATGPGVIAIFASSVATENAVIAALGIAFVAFTSPVSGHAIAMAAHSRDSRREAE